MPQPNILIVMVDQLAPAFLPIHGHPLVKAPHLAALAARGAVFDNAYCNSPLCSPSRTVFMTGSLPSRTGGYDNAAEFRADIPTFAHYLRRLGYRTVLSGKMHFCGPDQMHGFEERLTTDIYPADYGWTPDWDQPLERPSWYHNMSSVTDAGLCVRTNQIDFDEEVAFAAERAIFDHVRGSDERPFLHGRLAHPSARPVRHYPRPTGTAIATRTSPAARAGRRRAARSAFGPAAARVRDGRRRAVTDAQVRNARHAYFGAISFCDDHLGRLLGALEATGQGDTVVIFTRRPRRNARRARALVQDEFFRGRVPRPARRCGAGPRSARPQIASAVSLVDLLPTLVELAGGDATGAGEPDRRPLPAAAPLGCEDGHDEVFGEYLAEGAVAPIVMIRRGRHKFVHSPADPDQLYDLGDDPDERRNLAARAGAARVVQAFRAEVARRWDIAALDRAVRDSQRRRRLVDEALAPGPCAAGISSPFRDASRQYVRNTIDLGELEAMARFPRLAGATDGSEP